MAKSRGLLRVLLEDGRSEGLFALARLGGDPTSLDLDGLNLVTASVLAAIPEVNKLALVRRVGELVPDCRYADLFSMPFRALHPQRAKELEALGFVLDEAAARAYAEPWDLYDLLFSTLPLDLGSDILSYALGRGLRPSREDLSRLKSCAAGHGSHSPREVDARFGEVLGQREHAVGLGA